ncbi:MAG: hydroxyacylglutathione hydrolase [Gammaproteobacteria bacterium]
MRLDPLPIFQDNYVWLLANDAGEALVVDPGEDQAVQRALTRHGLKLGAILITHHHPDHTGGIAALRAIHDVPVYGPAAEAARIPHLSQPLRGGDVVDLPQGRAQVLDLPGHTLGQIGYLIGDLLFCGDSLFSAGCGRLFEGSPAQMYHSLHRLAALPGATRVCCTHEYTLANLAFAMQVEPHNPAVRDHAGTVRALREAGQPSLPSRIDRECAINPFLRTHVPAVREAAARHAGATAGDEIEVFAQLRAWKDRFRG